MQHFTTLDDPKLMQLITGGAVGVLPTDTVYGVVAAASNPAAVAALYALKKRDKKPGTIIAASIDQLVELGIPRRYLTAVQQFWPGAVSVIVPAEINLEYLHLGQKSLACRIPSGENIHSFLEKTGPLVTSSANTPGDPPANTIKCAHDYFGDKVDFYVYGGDLSDNQPSTIIRVVDDAVEVLRQGSVVIDSASERN